MAIAEIATPAVVRGPQSKTSISELTLSCAGVSWSDNQDNSVRARGTAKELAVLASPEDAKKTVWCQPRYLGGNASIVFVGPRGNGKSTLAIMAGLILKRQFVDADDHFMAVTGLLKAEYRRKYGGERFRSQELESTQAMLTRYDKDSVIACGPCVAAKKCRTFMDEYKRTHPIVYVMRPVADIEEYLGVREPGKMEQWMSSVHMIYRRISTFELFNLPEHWKDDRRCEAQEALNIVLPHRLISQKRAQALQKTQTLLTRFLGAAFGRSLSPLCDGVYPCMFPNLPEQRIYSSAVCIPLASLDDGEVDLAKLSEGADAVELLLDAESPRCTELVASGAVARFVAEIRRHLAVPVIYHVHQRAAQDIDWTPYFNLLHKGLRFAPEYLTVNLEAPDMEIRALIQSRGSTRIIGHAAGTTAQRRYWQSPEPLRYYKRAVRSGCSLVMLSHPCETITDNFSCLVFVNQVNAMPEKLPIIAYNTGNLGLLSNVCNPTLSPVLHAPNQLVQASSWAPTSITLEQKWRMLFSLQILSPLEFCVVGSTVKNSLSPAMHNAAFQSLGMPHCYRIQELGRLQDLKSIFQDPRFGGASVSLPFKIEVLNLVGRLSPSAEVIGASNTILPLRRLNEVEEMPDPRSKMHRHRAGPVTMLFADNTDWMGICACLSRSISPANSVNPQTTALVVGAGGMARAAVYSLLYLGLRNLCLFNRTLAHARSLAEHFENVFGTFVRNLSHQIHPKQSSHSTGLRIKVLETLDAPWPEGFDQPTIAVCAIKTTYGKGSFQTPMFKLPWQWMKSPTGGVVVELAFHSPETSLMQQMRTENHPGWTVVDPVEVLFEQACAQFELFSGNRAPRTAIWKACLNEYAEKMRDNAYASQ